MSTPKMGKWSKEPEAAATIRHDTDEGAFVFLIGEEEVLRLSKSGGMSVYGRPCGVGSKILGRSGTKVLDKKLMDLAQAHKYIVTKAKAVDKATDASTRAQAKRLYLETLVGLRRSGGSAKDLREKMKTLVKNKREVPFLSATPEACKASELVQLASLPQTVTVGCSQ